MITSTHVWMDRCNITVHRELTPLHTLQGIKYSYRKFRQASSSVISVNNDLCYT